MWKKCLACACVLTLLVLLDPTLTPAQPPSFGWGKKGDRDRDRKSDGPGTFPSSPNGPPSFSFGRKSDGPPSDKPTFSFGPPGSNPSGPGGPSRGRDPERGWSMLVNLTGSNGDTVDLSKIPPQTHAMLKGFAERSGGIPLPESGIWTKDVYMDHFAKSEAARASFAANGSNNNNNNSPSDSNSFGRDRDRMRDPNAFGPGGWNPGGWNPGGWDQNMWGQRPPFEKKDAEEEKPVAMRYGKLPKNLPGWFEEQDTDKDGQVSLYEWRKAGKDSKEFLEMDLNGDGLVTADEYLRFARQKNIDTKVAEYEEGIRGPGNWGLNEKPDTKGTSERPKGPGNWGWQKGENKSDSKSDNKDRGDKDKGDNKDREKRGNPWSKRP
jgi:hypothetical protein